MDITKPGVLAAVMFGSIAGDAAVGTSTMAVSVGLPAKVTAAGLTPYAAEELFGSDLSRLPDGQHALVCCGERSGKKMGRRRRMIRASRPQVAI